MSSEQYWRNQLAQSEAEYEQIIAGLRDEVEKQRRRCTELMHDQAMQRATAAADVRNFCVNYITEAKQQQQSSPRTNAAAAAASTAAKNVETIPLPALLGFLHEYSHGLLQMPENRRKRERQEVSVNPLHHRLRQRMFARHRLTGREDDVLEESMGEMGGALPADVSSPASPLMGPSATAPAGPRFANAVVLRTHNNFAAGAATPRTSVAAAPSAAFGGGGVETAAGPSAATASSSSASGGTVMAASVFGLPTLPTR